MPRRPRSERPESRWGGPPVAFAAILALAGALRLVGIQYALPFPLLNPDKGNIVPRAWSMVHGGGLDPHWFDYPSLVMYLLAPFQAWEAEPSYLAARLVIVVIAVGGVAAAWWLGHRAYGTTAGFVAAAVTAVETTHVAYSRMAVTDVPLTLGITVALTLMISGRIELAGLAVGLAASAKYPGILLLAPLLAAAWGAWRRLAIAGALTLLAFAATSPFAIVHLGQAAGDAWRVQQAARAGWLGFEHDHVAPVAFAARLWDGLGPALLIAAARLAVALVRRRRADLVLAVFVLVYFASLMTIHAHFDRYVLPFVPVLGALAGRLRSLAPVTILMLVIPLTWAVPDTRDLTRTDARIVAHGWVERNLPSGSKLAADSSTPASRLSSSPTRAAEAGRADRSEPGRGPSTRARRSLRRRHRRSRGSSPRGGRRIPARNPLPR